MLRKYVDDVVAITSNFKLGERLKNGQITRTKEDLEEDIRNKVTRSEVTLGILKEVADSITPYLKFTGECSKNKSKVPVLDTQIWLAEETQEGRWYKGNP